MVKRSTLSERLVARPPAAHIDFHRGCGVLEGHNWNGSCGLQFSRSFTLSDPFRLRTSPPLCLIFHPSPLSAHSARFSLSPFSILPVRSPFSRSLPPAVRTEALENLVHSVSRRFFFHEIGLFFSEILLKQVKLNVMIQR